MSRVENNELRDAALRQMAAKGMPLQRIPAGSRAMIYEKPNGETVRLRTSNDHILMIVAESADLDSTLNIEGTDYLLVVMPKEPHSNGPINSYLLPTDLVVTTAKDAHKEWLESEPNTKGYNTTRNIWFCDNGRASGGFAEKWRKYLIDVPESTPVDSAQNSAVASTEAYTQSPHSGPGPASETVAGVIEATIQKISSLTGTPKEMIKIEVKIGG